MTRKWRPGLGLVIGGALAGTLLLSLLGLIALRYLGPEIGFRQAAVFLALVIAAVTAIPGWLLVRLLVRPIHALEAYAKAQEEGQVTPPPQHFGTKELDVTARRVIAMTQALRDREATIRAYTDHVTHELKTPVSAIRAATELLEDSAELTAEDHLLLTQIDGARIQLEQQLAALRKAAQARETRYLGRCTLSELRLDLIHDHSKLTLEITGTGSAIPISAQGLAIVLGQLLRNAAENGASKVAIADTDCGTIAIQDNGTGISDGNAARIFEPFFTTKHESGGTGIGLAVVRNILVAHRGDIRLLPQSNAGGALFEISFEQDAD